MRSWETWDFMTYTLRRTISEKTDFAGQM